MDRVHREPSSKDLETIAGVYHDWRNTDISYEGKVCWWKSASLEDIDSQSYVMTPGRYIGAEEVEDYGIPFAENISELSTELYEQFDTHKIRALTFLTTVGATGNGTPQRERMSGLYTDFFNGITNAYSLRSQGLRRLLHLACTSGCVQQAQAPDPY